MGKSRGRADPPRGVSQLRERAMAKAASAKSAKTPPDPAARILAGAMEAAAATGWRKASLADIAAAAGVSLAELHAHFADKPAILRGLVDYADRAVLAGAGKRKDAGESPRDRLFDVLMRRFDALKPFRPGLAAVMKEMGGIGVGDAICGVQRMMRSLGWMLEAAGIGTGGMAGNLRVKGLAVVYAATFSTWLKDDSEDMAKTMAALDKNLDRAERWTSFFGRKGKAAEPDAQPA
jgi:AcrR family transcriptional regulator